MEALREQLDEYTTALERLERGPHRRDGRGSRALARQLSYLEQRVLAVQTELDRISLLARLLPHEVQDAEGQDSSERSLNPWHPDLYIWSYVGALAIFVVGAILLRIALG
jgi:hypothetical protein